MKKIISITIVAALLLANVFIVNNNNVYGKTKKVSSVKVLKVKKKVTLKVGQKKKFTVKVKAKKKYSKFTVKSSNKKIVSVKKSGKKIVLKGRKSGKAKITVKSKTNKKKKHVFTVIVKKNTSSTKESKDTNKNSSENNKSSDNQEPQVVIPDMTATYLSYNTFEITFAKEIELDNDGIIVEAKKTRDDDYKELHYPVTVTKENNKKYTVFVDTDSSNENVYFRFTVKGKDLTAECRIAMDNKLTKESCWTGVVDEIISEYVPIDCSVGSYKLKSIKDVPTGVSYELFEGKSIHFKGKISKVGNYTTTFEIEDGDGFVYTFYMHFVVAANDAISVLAYPVETYGCSKAGMIDRYGNPTEETDYASGAFELYISGGSGFYDFVVIKDEDNIININPDRAEAVEYAVSKPGTYSADIRVKDSMNNSIYKDFKVNLVVKEMAKLSGYLRTKSGKPVSHAEIFAYPRDESSYYRRNFSNEDGYYEVYAKPGMCSVEALAYTSRVNISNINMEGEVTRDIVFDDVYVVDINSENNYGPWFDVIKDLDETRKEYVGLGNRLSLPLGEYALESENYGIDEGVIYHSVATLNLDVYEDMEATPVINTEVINPGSLKVGDNTIEGVAGKYSFYKFIVPSTGEYTFESLFEENEDLAGALYSEDLDMIAYNDVKNVDDLNFKITQTLYKDQVCYLVVNNVDYKDYSGPLKVSFAGKK